MYVSINRTTRNAEGMHRRLQMSQSSRLCDRTDRPTSHGKRTEVIDSDNGTDVSDTRRLAVGCPSCACAHNIRENENQGNDVGGGERGAHSHEDEMRVLWPHRNVLFGLNDEGKFEDVANHLHHTQQQQHKQQGADIQAVQSEAATQGESGPEPEGPQ